MSSQTRTSEMWSGPCNDSPDQATLLVSLTFSSPTASEQPSCLFSLATSLLLPLDLAIAPDRLSRRRPDASSTDPDLRRRPRKYRAIELTIFDAASGNLLKSCCDGRSCPTCPMMRRFRFTAHLAASFLVADRADRTDRKRPLSSGRPA